MTRLSPWVLCSKWLSPPVVFWAHGCCFRKVLWRVFRQLCFTFISQSFVLVSKFVKCLVSGLQVTTATYWFIKGLCLARLSPCSCHPWEFDALMLFRSWLLTLILQAKVTASSMDRRRPGVTSHEVLQLDSHRWITLKHVNMSLKLLKLKPWLERCSMVFQWKQQTCKIFCSRLICDTSWKWRWWPLGHLLLWSAWPTLTFSRLRLAIRQMIVLAMWSRKISRPSVASHLARATLCIVAAVLRPP